jgi:hypothetical protein
MEIQIRAHNASTTTVFLVTPPALQHLAAFQPLAQAVLAQQITNPQQKAAATPLSIHARFKPCALETVLHAHQILTKPQGPHQTPFMMAHRCAVITSRTVHLPLVELAKGKRASITSAHR